MSLTNKGLKIASFIEACGGNVNVAAKKLTDFLNKPENDPMKLRTSDFSIKEMYEAVDVTQFPILTSTLISKQVMDGYNAEPKILDQLVTPFTSSQETDKIPGAFVKGDLFEVKPGAPYDHTGDMEEKYATIQGQKRGAILDITEEAVKFDQTGLIMLRASQFGQRAAADREKRGIYTIFDYTGYRAYRPFGIVSDLYANAANDSYHAYDNLTDQALADYSDIDAALALFGTMKDDNGEPISVNPNILLVPKLKETIANRIIGSSILIGGSTGENNIFQGKFKVLSSAYVDAVATLLSATGTWILGDFKRQYLEKIVIPLEVQTRSKNDGNEDGWERDIVASYKVRHYTQVGAIDYRYCVKSTGAS